jgi:hypothetical protein
MIATKLQPEKEIPATLPACPRCGRAEHVRSSATRGDVREFRCFSGICKGHSWFRDPSREFRPSGPKPNLRQRPRILELRKRGWTFARIGERLGITAGRARTLAVYRVPVPCDGRFEIRISPKMLPALNGLFRDAMRRECKSHAQMCQYLSERIEADAASYALAHTVTVPEHGRNRPPKVGLSRQGLDAYSTILAVEK